MAKTKRATKFKPDNRVQSIQELPKPTLQMRIDRISNLVKGEIVKRDRALWPAEVLGAELAMKLWDETMNRLVEQATAQQRLEAAGVKIVQIEEYVGGSD